MSLLERSFAACYDPVTARVERAGMAARRREVLGGLTGRVVEVGAGTGMNLAAYGPGVTDLVLCEPSDHMARRLRRKLDAHPRARLVEAPAERIPLRAGWADAAVCTLVLCTVPDPRAALAELRRVLAPGGRLAFIEHVRSHDPRLARWQDRCTPLWRPFAGGCHPNRDTLGLLEREGWRVHAEHGEMPASSPLVKPLVWGTAVPS